MQLLFFFFNDGFRDYYSLEFVIVILTSSVHYDVYFIRFIGGFWSVNVVYTDYMSLITTALLSLSVQFQKRTVRGESHKLNEMNATA